MPLFRNKAPKHLSLETQLQTLADHGINLLPDRTVDEFLISFPREDYESSPFGLVLFVLGGEVESRPCGRHFSNDIYTFDAECIEDHGDYRSQVLQLCRIAGDDLPVEDISDTIDIDAGIARIELTLDGRTHEFEPHVDNDWFDPDVIFWLDALLAARGSTRRFFLHDTGDQNLVTICTTPDRVAALSKATGLVFHAAD